MNKLFSIMSAVAIASLVMSAPIRAQEPPPPVDQAQHGSQMGKPALKHHKVAKHARHHHHHRVLHKKVVSEHTRG